MKTLCLPRALDLGRNATSGSSVRRLDGLNGAQLRTLGEEEESRHLKNLLAAQKCWTKRR